MINYELVAFVGLQCMSIIKNHKKRTNQKKCVKKKKIQFDLHCLKLLFVISIKTSRKCCITHVFRVQCNALSSFGAKIQYRYHKGFFYMDVGPCMNIFAAFFFTHSIKMHLSRVKVDIIITLKMHE